MRVPKKITPDHLKDTIVEIRYNSDFPKELILGYLVQIFNNEFKYINLNINTQDSNLSNQTPNPNLLFDLLGINSYFSNELIKIQFVENNIIFNCIKEYIGWEKYFKLIYDVLLKLKNKEIIKDFNRVGIRYISQFDGISIFENINGNINLNIPNFNLENSILRIESIVELKKIFIVLTNNTQIIQLETPNKIKCSLVDINVYEHLQNCTDLGNVSKSIDEIHNIQKNTFFTLINENFLNLLNPEY